MTRFSVGTALWLLFALLVPAMAQSEELKVVSVAAEGTQFRLTLSDGRVLRSPELVNATLTVATPAGPRRVRLAVVDRDPAAKSDDIWLHTMLVEQPDGTMLNLCTPGPDGREQGFPLASHMHPDGRTETTAPEVFDLVCTGGARAKCVRFGYRPWIADDAAVYNACIRMVRADYCGDGAGTTRDGMSIDLYDDKGVQTTDMLPVHAFEAGWTAQGAVCVAHVRVKENASLDELERSCPRLTGKVGAVCTEGSARGMGALIFNRSFP